MNHEKGMRMSIGFLIGLLGVRFWFISTRGSFPDVNWVFILNASFFVCFLLLMSRFVKIAESRKFDKDFYRNVLIRYLFFNPISFFLVNFCFPFLGIYFWEVNVFGFIEGVKRLNRIRKAIKTLDKEINLRQPNTFIRVQVENAAKKFGLEEDLLDFKKMVVQWLKDRRKIEDVDNADIVKLNEKLSSYLKKPAFHSELEKILSKVERDGK